MSSMRSSKAAQLPPAELSTFLCNNVLLGGVGAMTPMIFFVFETYSCYLGEKGAFFETDQCTNTLGASMWLSIYLLIISGISIFSKMIPREEREEELTYVKIAKLSLRTKQKIQGLLISVTVLASMYLFSVLGVAGNPNETNFIFGATGVASLVIAVLTEMYIIVRRTSKTIDQQEGNPRRLQLGKEKSLKSTKRISITNIGKEMKMLGMV